MKVKKKKPNPKLKFKSANHEKGIILRSLDGGLSLFRKYGRGGSFKDYEIVHHDLAVQILDESAEFVESEDGTKLYLDYSRKALGLKTNE